MTFARWVFAVCGVYGLVTLVPLYFMEEKLGRDYPPAITHPEFFYTNIGLAVVWQVAFLVMSRDPLRFRPLMLVGVLEKLSYGIPAAVLYTLGRSPAPVLATGSVDLLMAVLFVLSYLWTAPSRTPSLETR